MDAGKSGDGTIQVHTEDTALEQKHDLGTYPLVIHYILITAESYILLKSHTGAVASLLTPVYMRGLYRKGKRRGVARVSPTND